MPPRHEILESENEGIATRTLRCSDADVEAAFAPGAGMIGCSLRERGEELLGQRGGLAKYAETGSTMGIPLLYPWANRLAGLSYEVGGHSVTLDPDRSPVRMDPNGLPIHGLLAASPHWGIAAEEANDQAACLTARLDFAAHPELLAAFPFPHAIELKARLAGAELTISTTVTATGSEAVPVSFGFHPYLSLPGVPREDWVLDLPVRSQLVLDEQMIPTGERQPVVFEPEPLGDRDFDDGFADLDQPARFTLEGGGRTIAVEFGEGYPFAQVYAPPEQELICFEPMTSPTNALVSGEDLPLVAPGESFRAEFSIAVSAA